jgi:hypothetical protein
LKYGFVQSSSQSLRFSGAKTVKFDVIYHFLGFYEPFIYTNGLSISPDRADILWALGRMLHCPQIKARAGKGLVKMPKPVAANILYLLF